MKVVLLAGGLGTRLAEETVLRPKPMVEVGGRPILWHIMQLYASQGFTDFVVAAGYKGEVIADYFARYRELESELHLDFVARRVETLPSRSRRSRSERHVVEAPPAASWRVEVVDTGEATLTAGRVARLKPQLAGERFMLTYGDGLSDVDLRALLAFHRSHGRLATLTGVHPPLSRTGLLSLEEDSVLGPRACVAPGWVNGGFFVFEAGIFDYLGGDRDTLEASALVRLARAGELMAYRHDGFWQCMDTLPERELLEALWRSGGAPWAKVRQPVLL
jgi:glucose-1-phosphate cytidylyltransferase